MRAQIKTYRARILVVEEEDWCRQFLSSVIKLIGQEFRLVNTVTEALEALKESAFDLVITDLRLPEHARLLEECRHTSPGTRFLLVVQQRTQPHNLVYMEQVDVVFKPLCLDELVRKIRHAIRQRQLHQAEEEFRRLKQGAFRILV
jgi:DNA-binding NtrC family response regulator